MQTLNDRIVSYLEMLGVEYVFGIPGGHSSALFEALARSEARGGPRAILARHETGAVSMADGYARETGRLGVASATTGPGATNTLTGVASAFFDHVPLLVMTAQTPVRWFGRGAFQESSSDGMDTNAMLSECTRYSSIVTHPEQLEYKLAQALMIALRDDRGPVHLSLPQDLSRVPALSPEPMFPDLPALLERPRLAVDVGAVDALIDEVATTVKRGGRIALLVGHECRGATDEIVRFAERVGAIIATTPRGKAWIDPYHPLARGIYGFAGHATAHRELLDDDVDLILAIGTALGQWSTYRWNGDLLGSRLVHIHPMGRYFARSPMARLHVLGDPATVMGRLSAGLDARGVPPGEPMKVTGGPPAPPAHIERRPLVMPTPEQGGVHPVRILEALMDGFVPPETRVIVDVTNWLAWSLHHYFTRHHQNYRHSSELCAMGWGIGACVGTALGAGGAPVVCLVGDGGALMSGQEICVAVAEGLSVVYIVLNDGAYGMVRQRHRVVTPDAPLPFDFARADFAAMARAMGARGHTIERIEDLAALDREALLSGGPVVLDVRVHPDVQPNHTPHPKVERAR